MSQANNHHAAHKIFNLVQAAELKHRLDGTPHAEFLGRKRHKVHGQARKELDRIVALGDDAGRFVEIFLGSFEEYRT